MRSPQYLHIICSSPGFFSLDIILRAEIVERAKAGDKCVFTGTFIVVPDISQMSSPGMNAEVTRGGGPGFGGKTADGGLGNQGVTGLKSLGVRDLQYRTAFLACMVNSVDAEGKASIYIFQMAPGTLLTSVNLLGWWHNYAGRSGRRA